MPGVHIGCSGFMYDHWRGPFYPQELPKRRWFQFYAGVFGTVELNVTFYNLPPKETFTRWYEETPPGFVFSVKGSRFITHVKKLRGVAEPVEAFCSRALALREKLGVVLWQFPPGFRMSVDRLSEFLSLIRPYGLRHTFEFREKTWISKAVISSLREEGACLCMADWPEFLSDLPVTADFVYFRRHGAGGNCATSYSPAELRSDAARVRSHRRQGRDVFMYFNNDAQGYAPRNAQELLALIKKR